MSAQPDPPYNGAAARPGATRLVAVRNVLDRTVSLRSTEAPDKVLTLSPRSLAPCELWLGSGDGARSGSQTVEVEISDQGTVEARFWIWIEDGLVRYSRHRPHDPGGAVIPGRSWVGGSRVLTIGGRRRGPGGLLRRLRKYLG